MAFDLTAIRKTLEGERAQLSARSIPSPELARGDEADLAAVEQAKDRARWLVNDQKMRLAEIDKALARIESGKYGVCDVCNKSIALERMEAIPHATLCISCQSKSEKKSSRR